MDQAARIPLDVCPQVIHAWKSVHVGPSTQSFVVDGLWGVHLYRYSGEVKMDGQSLRFEPGHAGFTPPGARMEYRFEGICTHVFAHVLWPEVESETTALPYVFPSGNRFESIWAKIEEIVALRGTRRADVRAWDVVLELADFARVPTTPNNEAIALALRYLDARMSDDLSSVDLARAASISHNHLCRLFKKHLDQTPMEAIRQRRIERAQHLLVHTTLPIKEIARQVGIDDLQRFNKTVRRETGRSPRELRRPG